MLRNSIKGKVCWPSFGPPTEGRREGGKGLYQMFGKPLTPLIHRFAYCPDTPLTPLTSDTNLLLRIKPVAPHQAFGSGARSGQHSKVRVCKGMSGVYQGCKGRRRFLLRNSKGVLGAVSPVQTRTFLLFIIFKANTSYLR